MSRGSALVCVVAVVGAFTLASCDAKRVRDDDNAPAVERPPSLEVDEEDVEAEAEPDEPVVDGAREPYPGSEFSHGDPNFAAPRSLRMDAALEHALLRVPVRVHAGASSLNRAEMQAVFAEVNEIWQQANICFEFEIVLHDGIRADGIDVWLRPANGPPNGQRRHSDHDIWVADRPALSGARVKRPAKRPIARTLAHELGHGIGIWHTNRPYWGPGRTEFLMSSQTLGAQLARSPFDQVRRARETALAKCVPNFLPTACEEPRFLYEAGANAVVQQAARERLDAERRQHRRGARRPRSTVRPGPDN